MNPASSQPLRARAMAVMLMTIFLWAVGPIFVKGFTRYYDSWTQNAARYVAATVVLFALAAFRRQPLFTIARSQWLNLFLVVAANTLMQSCFARMYYYLYPAVATLVGQVNVIFVIILTFMFHKDERNVIRSPFFLFGSILALCGVAVVVLARNPETMARLNVTESRFWIGIWIVMLWSAASALYVVSIKPLVRKVEPFVAFTHVAWITTLVLIALMLLFGRPADLWRQPAAPLWGVFWSGVLCIGVAHVLYYISIRAIKVVIVVTLMQMVPVITCAISGFWYRDHLSPLQLVGGGAALCGAWLASMAQARVRAPEERAASKILAGEQIPS